MNKEINVHDKLCALASSEFEGGEDRFGWRNGKFRVVRQLQIGERGKLGELFLIWMLNSIGLGAERSSSPDPKLRPWDVLVREDQIKLEVKTATLGFKRAKFQHDTLERDRDYDGMVFIDIAPNNIYLSMFCKYTFNWEKGHDRRYGQHHKHDVTLKSLVDDDRELRSLDQFSAQYAKLRDEILEYRKNN